MRNRHIKRIRERDIYPVAVEVIAAAGGSMTTTALIAALRPRFKLNQEDRRILTGRKDDRFSQIVRNIKSHRLTKSNPIRNGVLVDVEGGFELKS